MWLERIFINSFPRRLMALAVLHGHIPILKHEFLNCTDTVKWSKKDNCQPHAGSQVTTLEVLLSYTQPMPNESIAWQQPQPNNGWFRANISANYLHWIKLITTGCLVLLYSQCKNSTKLLSVQRQETSIQSITLLTDNQALLPSPTDKQLGKGHLVNSKSIFICSQLCMVGVVPTVLNQLHMLTIRSKEIEHDLTLWSSFP